MAELTGLQRRASKFLDKAISFRISADETIDGYFVGFDKDSNDRAVIQRSNAADRTTLPLMSVINFFEGIEDDPDAF